MSLHAKVSGAWTYVTPYVKSAGAWVVPESVWAKVSGVWKQVWPELMLQPAALDQTDIGEGEAASFQYYFTSTNVLTNQDHGGGVDLGAWLGAGVAADYEFKYTIITDVGTGSGAIKTVSHVADVWDSCSESPSWQVDKDGSNNGHRTLEFTLKIRRASDAEELRSVIIKIKAQRVPFIP